MEDSKAKNGKNTSLGLTIENKNSLRFEISEQTLARFAKEAEQNKVRIELEGKRIRELYGNISEREILKVLDFETAIKKCQDCKGLPCKKPLYDNPLYTPEIVFNQKLTFTKKICRYEKLRRLNKKYGLAKIPPEYIGKTFSDYEVDDLNARAVKAAKMLVNMPDTGAYFFGNVGTGKTFLVSILAQEIIRSGREVLFCTLPTISVQLRSTFYNDAKLTEVDLLEKLYTTPTLIIDDVGIEKQTRFICATLCNIFNERYNSKLQTIITSNYTLKELEEIFNHPSDGGETVDGTRIYDRCKKFCSPVELKGNSRR